MPPDKDVPKEMLFEKIKPLLERLDAYPRTGEAIDKKFFDDLWEAPKGDFSKTDLA
jgi:hypothetical protein